MQKSSKAHLPAIHLLNKLIVVSRDFRSDNILSSFKKVFVVYFVNVEILKQKKEDEKKIREKLFSTINNLMSF